MGGFDQFQLLSLPPLVETKEKYDGAQVKLDQELTNKWFFLYMFSDIL